MSQSLCGSQYVRTGDNMTITRVIYNDISEEADIQAKVRIMYAKSKNFQQFVVVYNNSFEQTD